MTTHFIDLRVLLDPETSAPELLGVLYEKLHLALVRHRRDDIGVSFPQYNLNPRALGHILRLHGDREALQELMATDWLGGMRDHVRASNVASVPEDAEHRTVQRKQFKTSVERLRRRRMRRKNETREQARQAIPDDIQRHVDLPFVHLRSSSSGQVYCLFISLGAAHRHPAHGSFNSHGLSRIATVPWF